MAPLTRGAPVSLGGGPARPRISRPLTRDEERRSAVQTTERQPSLSLDAAPILNLTMAEFTAMVLVGMLCGVSAVLITHLIF